MEQFRLPDQPYVINQPPTIRGTKQQSVGDVLSIFVTDNKGFIVSLSITEDDRKNNKVFVATDTEQLIKIVMEYAPKMSSPTGVKCCND